MEVGFDRAVLFVELGQVGDKVFDDVGVWERVDFGRGGEVCDSAETSEGVDAVDVHSAGAADPFAAGAAEGEGGVDFVFDAD